MLTEEMEARLRATGVTKDDDARGVLEGLTSASDSALAKDNSCVLTTALRMNGFKVD